MSSEHVERRLAAILAADVAGSCRLIGIDEEGTLAQLRALRKTLFDPKIAEHHGHIVKNTGDGALVEFASVVDAVRCAVEVQRCMAEQNIDVPQDKRIEFRIGIHVGDIIAEDDDIFGDGVNIAVRLEGNAEPGGISLSDDAYRHIRDKLDIAFDDAGDQKLKNIERPIRVFRVRDRGIAASQRSSLALPDKPSIAVLPFNNMSGDPEQEYFADGVVEEIITALSRMRWLFVIARNSSFIYKGRAVGVKQVGRELGVGYVLEGGVRKAANRVRITAQLIDASTGVHLWADHFEGALDDIFDLQDEVTASVVGAIAPKLEWAEIERTKRKPTESLDAYDHYLRAIASFHQGHRDCNRQANEEALRLSYRAIELDPCYSSAYGLAAHCYASRGPNDWMVDRVKEIAEARRLARRAAELGHDDALALSRAGWVLAFLCHDLDAGDALLERALALDPNLQLAWRLSAWVKVFLGDLESAIEHFTHSISHGPRDPFIFAAHHGISFAHFYAGRYDDAVAWAEKALAGAPNHAAALRLLAAAHALAGRLKEAQSAIARMCELDSSYRISYVKRTPSRRPDHIARYEEGLRKAGLPE